MVTRKLLTVILCFGISLNAQSLPLATEKPLETVNSLTPQQALTFRDVRLKNGLRVIISEDHSSPTYSICVGYNVGSKDERPGQTGVALLTQFLMFQGSENVGLGEHLALAQSNGGYVGGVVEPDQTLYFETLSSKQLDLGLFLEADRMGSLNITQAKFGALRDLMRKQKEAAPDWTPPTVNNLVMETVLKSVYTNPAYSHSRSGSLEDLKTLTLADALQFHKTYYSPNNAVLTLVGDVQTEEALSRIRKYFENIQTEPMPNVMTPTEPGQTAEKRQVLKVGSFVGTINVAFKGPPFGTSDWYALNLLMQILAGGPSSRLSQKLVKEGAVAESVSGFADGRRGPSLAIFQIGMLLTAEQQTPDPEPLLYEEIERTKNVLITNEELKSARLQVRRLNQFSLLSTRARAIVLSRFALIAGDPNLINTLDDKNRQVTQEDIQRVANLYLKSSNRTVVTTLFDPKLIGLPGSVDDPAKEPNEP
jgi:zinc protease